MRNSIPNEIRTASNVALFKDRLSSEKANVCTCNLCKDYVKNIGYNNSLIKPRYLFDFLTFPLFFFNMNMYRYLNFTLCFIVGVN